MTASLLRFAPAVRVLSGDLQGQILTAVVIDYEFQTCKVVTPDEWYRWLDKGTWEFYYQLAEPK